MEKKNKLQPYHNVIVGNRIRKKLENSFLYPFIQPNFKSLEKIVNEPLKLAIFGEYNAGKTTFINRLLGLSLPTKWTPTTKVITTIKYAENARFEIEYKDKNSDIDKYSVREYEGLEKLNDVLEDVSDLIEIKEVRIYINNPILKTFEILDTPGFNDDEYEKVTKRLFGKVNFAIWIFTSSQAGKDSEVNILEEFQKKSVYQNNIYAFINQADMVGEEEIKAVQEDLTKLEKYFINKEILAVSSKKTDKEWDEKFKILENDLKKNILNEDIKISQSQINEELSAIEHNIGTLYDNFKEVKQKIVENIDGFLQEDTSRDLSKKRSEIKKSIEDHIKKIKDDVIENELYKNRILESGIKFLAFYKTIDSLDDIDKKLKDIYNEYIDDFKRRYKRVNDIILDQFDNKLLINDKDFDVDIRKKLEKIAFTLDTLSETKQLLIIGYIIGILTDDYIYKNLKEDDILKKLNQDVILNLIDLDLDLSYFIEEIKNIKKELDEFFDRQVELLDEIKTELYAELNDVKDITVDVLEEKHTVKEE